MSRQRHWGTGPGSELRVKKTKDGQRGAQSGRRKGRRWERSRTEESAGMGTALKGGLQHRGDPGGWFPAVSSLRSHPRLLQGLAPTSPSQLHRLGLGRGFGPGVPERLCPRGPHLELRGGAPRAQSEAGSTGSAVGPSQGAGPPLAGRGAGRRGGCHASRALGNLGLKATPSGGGGSSRALRPPARGGVCRRSPPLRFPPWAAAGPPPTRRRLPPTPLPHTAHTPPRRSPLPARPCSPLAPHPPLPPNLSEPRFLH